MSRTFILLKTQIINYVPINELRGPGNKKKNAAVILGFGIVALILFLCVYNITTAKILVQAGEQGLIPAYMVSISSFSVMFWTMFRSNGILFGSKDLDLLTALPVKSSEIISSKLSFMYLLNLLITAIFMIPGGIVWFVDAKADMLQFVLFMLSIFFVPLIPMCLASAAGILIAHVSSRFKNRSVFAVILTFLVLGLTLYIVFSIVQHSNRDASGMGAILAGQITGLYPLSKFFLQGENDFGTLSVSLFLVFSMAVLFLFIKIVAAKYSYYNTLASGTSKYRDKTVSFKAHSPFITLYRKELGRFFSSYAAVLNTGLGVVLLCLFSLFLLIIPPEKLGEYVGITDMNGFLTGYAPLVVASMLTLSCPSASSISLEGKNIWILQSSPISMKTILNSKIAVTITLHFFGYLFAMIAMLTRLQMRTGQVVSLIVVPVCYSLFIAVLGVSLNKKYPNYDWNSEVTVVKQSIPAIAVGIIGMFCVVLPVLLTWFLQFPIQPVLWTIAVVLIIATVIMYRKVCASD